MTNPSVVIITPTIGNDHLRECLESVSKQTYLNFKHLVVVDGSESNNEYYRKHQISLMMYLREFQTVTPIMLPHNVGGNGFYGHRVYAAFSYLVNEDYIIYLDEDNFIEPNHIESMIKTIVDKNLSWSYCFRNIVDKEGNFICKDECESLGKKPGVSDYCLVDTSAFCVKREVATLVAHNWITHNIKFSQWAADRNFFYALNNMAPRINYDGTGEYTLNYRLGGNENSPKKEFFLEGNRIMNERKNNAKVNDSTI